MMPEKYFKSQQDDEKVIMVVRRHWFDLIPSFTMAGFLYILGFFGAFILPFIFPNVVEGLFYNIYVLIISLLFLFNTAYVFSIWLMYYLNIDIVTTEHVVEIDQESLFSRKISELGFEKIQDVTASQRGMMQTMFNYGDVDVQTAGELPNFIFKSVPNPNDIAQKIMELEENFAHKNGLRQRQPESILNKPSETTPPNIEYPGNNQSL